MFDRRKRGKGRRENINRGKKREILIRKTEIGKRDKEKERMGDFRIFVGCV